jgi:restriction system protein
MSEQGKIQRTYTAGGRHSGYAVEIRHRELNKYQVIRGDNEHIVRQKARAKMAQWDEMWQRRQEAERKRVERTNEAQRVASQQQLAAERTQEAQDALAALERILSHTLSIDDTVDWESLKDRSPYSIPQPQEPEPPSIKEPQPSDAQYHVELGLLDMLVASRKTAKEQKAAARFKHDHEKWEAAMQEHAEKIQEHKVSLATWEEERAAYIQARDASNAAIDAQRADYLNSDPGAILDYCDLVLSNSEYPDYFPQSYELDYNPENRILIVDYQFPSISDLPTLQDVKYVKSRDEFTEKHISQAQVRRNFDSVLYQITLRTIHELYEADQVDALASIVFNGYTHSIDPATGREVTPCVLSVQAGKEEFGQIQLANIDPKVCFRGLKGIGSTRLHSLTPVAPILRIEREDARFIAAYAVVDGLQEEDNLAAMDWEDFEHLIRELFEKEFASSGGEVKVTRASRDGGVDAIAFDPDPIRGGKIVIQAKRYTNTVGVSFIRDLYGTVVNEGANKGIIVTTSAYGPDAYEFAKGKPLVLIDGNNLLHLLEKHGHKARIDLQEAKKLLAEQ